MFQACLQHNAPVFTGPTALILKLGKYPTSKLRKSPAKPLMRSKLIRALFLATTLLGQEDHERTNRSFPALAATPRCARHQSRRSISTADPYPQPSRPHPGEEGGRPAEGPAEVARVGGSVGSRTGRLVRSELTGPDLARVADRQSQNPQIFLTPPHPVTYPSSGCTRQARILCPMSS